MTEATEKQAARLCDECAPKATRASVVLCGKCAPLFRVIFLPDDVRTWEEISRDAYGDNGAAIEEFVKGLQIRIFNQQRELSALNKRMNDHAAKLANLMHRLRGAFSNDRSDYPTPVDDVSLIDAVTRIVRRYLWLRDGNGYAPEEGFACGGVDLDKLCDNGIREDHGVKA